MSWSELVKTALMGVDRAQLSPGLRQELEALGLPGSLPPERLLLEGAALLHSLNKAALELQTYAGDVPRPEKHDARQPCSAGSGHHLHLILDGPFRPALPEFIALLNETNKRLPPESLPVLFNHSLTDRRLWRQLRPAIGPAGAWLLRQNPDWEAINPWAEPEDWERGSARDRRRFLRRLHESAPAAAIARLRKTWPAESYRSKLGFLDILRTDPREADIDFLETCLDDARQEVRHAAADILSLHAASPLVERLFRRAARHLELHSGSALEVTLPGRFDDALRREGILEKPAEKYHTSPRGSWLMQMIARVPPERWKKHFGHDAAGCLRLFAATEHKKGFLLALTQAVNRHGGADWISALLDYWYDSKDDLLWKNAAADELIQQLPDDLFNGRLLHYLDREGPVTGEDSLPGRLLATGANWWDKRLTLRVIQGFQDWMSDAYPRYQTVWHYRNILQAAAFRSDTALIERLQKGWPMTARSWPQWREEVEAFINVLHFRKKMRQELENR